MMLDYDYIHKAQEYAEKELADYCEEYMLAMVTALIEDKATDTNVHNISMVGYEVFIFLANYLNGRKDVYFVNKPISNEELNRIANGIITILSGREIKDGKPASVCG